MGTSATAPDISRHKARKSVKIPTSRLADRATQDQTTVVALAAASAEPMPRPPTASNVGRLPGKISRARDALLGQFRPILTAHGLTDSQWRVLRVLSNNTALDAGQTADRAFLLPSSLSRILKDFNQRGLIASWAAPEDARRSMHALTKAGRKLVSDIDPHLQEVHRSLEAKFSVERLRQIADMLDAFCDELES